MWGGGGGQCGFFVCFFRWVFLALSGKISEILK